jgi:hypothetical protein
MWCTEGRRGAVKARHMAGEGGEDVGQSKDRTEQSRGLKVDEGTDLLFSKSARAPL